MHKLNTDARRVLSPHAFVKERNIPEYKHFISSFVDKVEVFDITIEVTIKVASFFASNWVHPQGEGKDKGFVQGVPNCGLLVRSET